ncbi:hypothetical protein J7394_06885 [Ruegeria sp. R13_0]|uniref:glycosyltransferase family 8 protein n=1 Tax=Ruegeria sp. R13_0 TaxID=2821099 RepID=UPI001ADD340A|nr:glycosyltransferase [Ruegeria sp. R13_0]MBO9433922.1 hypothetical protein [Ruegeria sp. R13_0]
MQVVYGVNRSFLFPALLSAYSAVKNARKSLGVTIFGQDFTGEDIAIIEQANQSLTGGTISYRKFDLDQLQGFSEYKSKYPAITMLPLFLPQLCEKRCIFVDADTLVVSDVWELLEMDLEGQPFAACVDMGLVTLGGGDFLRPSLQQIFRPGREHKKSLSRVSKSIRLGFIPGEGYFNAGIMVMDCSAIHGDRELREISDFEKLVPHIPYLPEQDRMNQLFQGRWFHLPIQWNTRPQIWFDAHSPKYRKMSKAFRQNLSDANRTPKIWHYVGGKKPWRATRMARLLFHRAYRDYETYMARFEKETGLTFTM